MTPVLKSVLGVLGLVLLFWCLWLALLFSARERILYPGATGLEAPAPFRTPEDVEVLEREIEEGVVYGWLLPPLGEGEASGLVVHFHGNGERIDLWAHGMRPWREAGYWLFLPEYRGYGRASGRPSEAGIVEDAVDLVGQALERTGVPPERLVFHGRSLGTGVAAQVGQRRPPAAWVLESGFTRVVAMTRRMLVPDFLVRDRFDTIGALRGTATPVLILHGDRDEVIPYRHAERLHAAIPGSRLETLSCGHNDCPPDHEAYWEVVLGFAAEVVEAGSD